MRVFHHIMINNCKGSAMQWYSVKKYIPSVKNCCYFVHLNNGEVFAAHIEEYVDDQQHTWVAEDGTYFNETHITHFCIPDPIEIE